MVAEPEEPDHSEADPEADETRLVDTELAEAGRMRAQDAVARLACNRHPQVDGKQRDRDREDGVGEEQHPVVLDEPGAGKAERCRVPATAGEQARNLGPCHPRRR